MSVKIFSKFESNGIIGGHRVCFCGKDKGFCMKVQGQGFKFT